MAIPACKGFLVRLPAGAGAALGASGKSRTLNAASARFELEPLFKVAKAGTGFAKGGSEWHLARLASGSLDASPWDAAHKAISRASLAGAMPEMVEPDLVQEWPFDRPREPGAPGISKEACAFDDQKPDLPGIPRTFAWHLDDDFSQLRSARIAAAAAGAGVTVRIAHLDTGYDSDHLTFPKDQIDTGLERNFVDAGAANDARDRGMKGVLKNPGHGTGTLSLLAGAQFRFSNAEYDFNGVVGGVPAARIVPIRVGNSVVQISTSTVAQGFAYVADLCAKDATRVDVLSMSMGGVASEAWADAVNRAYEAGVVLVTAAGNNFSAGFFGVPTHFIVYPARFRRVIAACGVMADRKPYYGLSLGTMQGNWGPESKMATALAACTPNVPWAQIGCPGIVDMDGAGTSAATPQVAAAAALYVQTHSRRLSQYPEPWMRAEMVRHALFASADRSADGGKTEKLGNGMLRAARALSIEPVDAGALSKTPADCASFSFLRVITGLGISAGAADRMLALEATQLAQRWSRTDEPNPLEDAVTDPDIDPQHVPGHQIRSFLERVETHPEASRELKTRVQQLLASGGSGGGPSRPRRSGRTTRPVTPGSGLAPPPDLAAAAPFAPPTPAFRRLRGYAVDPSLATELDTAPISQMVFHVGWEKLAPGPVGEYVEVIDVDPASGCYYEPVELDHPMLLAQDGLAPSEGTPQFHQQMVYAVCSLTIANFEHALGRRALWRPRPNPANEHDDSGFVGRLRVYPHALREANAYYSPDKVALLMGYFNATDDDRADHLPGGRVFTCLSHDILAHETTHALLDGMHRRFLLASNPDVLAFHEGFADIVALLQHFTFPEILRHQISATRGEIRSQRSLLGELAGQFGRSTGMRGALRSAIGERVDGMWRTHEPSPGEYEQTLEPHARGAILVGAVFDAFLSIYENRSRDLVRLASEGTGVLRPGAIHPDLVRRLADEAAKAAGHVLTMCIRALDYCPPTDITFGEYLRAVITADVDLVPDDDLNYRVAFVEAFRRRGIYPQDLRTLSVESLLWRGPQHEARPPSGALEDGLERLRRYATGHTYATSREEVFNLQREMRRELHGWLADHFKSGPDGLHDAAFLGLDPRTAFEVHSARFALRAGPDGGIEPQLLLGLLQTRLVPVDAADPRGPTMSFEGGCAIVANLRSRKVRYCIRKSLSSDARLARQQEHALRAYDSTRATYLGLSRLSLHCGGRHGGSGLEPFALLHRGGR